MNKIEVTIFENLFLFRRDEKRKWRAINALDALTMNPKIDGGVIQVVLKELNKLYP